MLLTSDHKVTALNLARGGNRWAHCIIFENGALLMYVLEGLSSVANFINA